MYSKEVTDVVEPQLFSWQDLKLKSVGGFTFLKELTVLQVTVPLIYQFITQIKFYLHHLHEKSPPGDIIWRRFKDRNIEVQYFNIQ